MSLFRATLFVTCAVILAPSVGAPRLALAVEAPAISKAPAGETVKAALFEHLEKQAGGVVKRPDFPSEKILVWMDKRNAAVAGDEKARYTLLYEHLLVAQKLMESDDVATRKRGYWMASESANFAGAKLKKDKWLLARIYEGFLLPKVTLANKALWQDPSRSRILEASVSVFGNAGEGDKRIRVLEWLISIGERTPDKTDSEALTLELNTLDWARGTLASLLSDSPEATRAQLERARALLRAIQSPDMEGFKHLQTKVQDRLNKLEKIVAP